MKAVRGTGIALFAAWLLWRAGTQSITHDEALVWRRFVTMSWFDLFTNYDASHHVLHTYLVKLATQIFGPAELVQRLPAVAGGVLYAIGCLRMATRIGLRGARLAAVLPALLLNPFVVDFLVASRGYALAMAFFVWHVDELLRGRPLRASLFAGLAVSANLTFLPACAATSLARLILHREQRAANAARLALPAALVIAVVCGGPLLGAEMSYFYTGTDSLWRTASDLMIVSFRHGARDYLPFALPAILVAAGCAFAAVAKRAPLPRFFGLGLLIAIVEIVALHAWKNLPFPVPRTGMYFFVLGTLFLVTGATAMKHRACSLPLLAIGVLYALQIEGTYFQEWRYDSATERMFDRALAAAPPKTDVRFCADWEYEPSLNFYRLRRGATSFAPIDRVTFEGCDFVLINTRYRFPGTRHDLLLSRNRLREIARDPWSGSVLYAADTP